MALLTVLNHDKMTGEMKWHECYCADQREAQLLVDNGSLSDQRIGLSHASKNCEGRIPIAKNCVYVGLTAS